ncbi:hypothetical protein [Microbacterium sp. Bi121]|uniref:hypothetical protein n=1 Tax=Microbacterium sp. Bi121 TaxID=2822348 RepID=UPI003442A7CD
MPRPPAASNVTGSPVRASTAAISIRLSGHTASGSRCAVIARQRVPHAPSDSSSSTIAAAPMRRRMSAASDAEAMIAPVRAR